MIKLPLWYIIRERKQAALRQAAFDREIKRKNIREEDFENPEEAPSSAIRTRKRTSVNSGYEKFIPDSDLKLSKRYFDEKKFDGKGEVADDEAEAKSVEVSEIIAGYKKAILEGQTPVTQVLFFPTEISALAQFAGTPRKKYFKRELEEKYAIAITKAIVDSGSVSINVGIKDYEAMHDGYEQSVQYLLLFALLSSCGYDPLLPVRRSDLKKTVGEDITKAILSLCKRTIGNGIVSEAALKRAVEPITHRLVEAERDYFASSRKPALSNTTMKIRKERQKENGALYPHGISTPLSETGTLEAAIEAWVEIDGDVFSKILRYQRDIRIAMTSSDDKMKPYMTKRGVETRRGVVKFEYTRRRMQGKYNTLFRKFEIWQDDHPEMTDPWDLKAIPDPEDRKDWQKLVSAALEAVRWMKSHGLPVRRTR